jgi:site-specific recombinase XerD
MITILNLTISRNLRKSTIKEYARSLNQYCNFSNKNPTELIEEAEVEEDNGIR